MVPDDSHFFSSRPSYHRVGGTAGSKHHWPVASAMPLSNPSDPRSPRAYRAAPLVLSGPGTVCTISSNIGNAPNSSRAAPNRYEFSLSALRPKALPLAGNLRKRGFPPARSSIASARSLDKGKGYGVHGPASPQLAPQSRSQPILRGIFTLSEARESRVPLFNRAPTSLTRHFSGPGSSVAVPWKPGVGFPVSGQHGD